MTLAPERIFVLALIISPPPLQLKLSSCTGIGCVYNYSIFIYRPTMHYKPTTLFRADVWGWPMGL